MRQPFCLWRIWLVLLLTWTGFAPTVSKAGPWQVLVLTGVNNHDWAATTPEVASALEEAGIFKVRIVTTKPVESPQFQTETNVDFTASDAVVLNWTDFGRKAPRVAWMDGLIQYVQNGGALVIIHAGSLESHPEWPGIAGLGWHEAAFGDRITWKDGKAVRLPKGEGSGSGHGERFSWAVTWRAPAHPIAAGLPPTWQHAQDELWHGTRGPAQNLEIIATAHSPITQEEEPVMWTVKAGKGRVFVTLLGHDAKAMKCPGFRHTLARGCEWAIGGKVSLPKPGNFPSR